MLHNTFSFSRWLLCAACTGGAVVGSTATCGNASAGEGGDLMFYVENGQLTVGRYDFDGGTGVVLAPTTEPIVLGELQASWEGGPNPGTDEPGIATDGSSPADPDGINFAFPANTSLTAQVSLLPVLGVNAAFWDGTGTPSFGALPQNIILEDPFLGEIELDGTATLPAGLLTAWQSDANGTAHDHFEYLLDADDATAGTGIYLFALNLATSDSAVTGTTLTYLLGYGGTTFDDETLEGLLETAEAFVETNIVPEPATAGLLALGGLALLRRRHA